MYLRDVGDSRPVKQRVVPVLQVDLFRFDVVADAHRVEVDDAVRTVGAGHEVRVLVSVHVHPAGQREAERSQFRRDFLGVNHLRRLGADAFAGPVEDVDCALLARPVVLRRPDGHVVESVQIGVTQRRDDQSNLDLDTSPPSRTSLHRKELRRRAVFALCVGVIGVERRTDDDVLQTVAVDVGDGHAVAEISAQLLASDVTDAGQVGRKHDDL